MTDVKTTAETLYRFDCARPDLHFGYGHTQSCFTAVSGVVREGHAAWCSGRDDTEGGPCWKGDRRAMLEGRHTE